GREEYEVVAFTATQIPNIDGRVYPRELAGELYPDGIPIAPESELEDLITRNEVDEVVFAYSDVTHEHVMHIGSRALAAGASFRLISPRETMLASSKPVVAVCAVRTGSGKSQTTRRVAALLRESGKRVAVLRHPMPYGNLVAQAVQRFERYEDLEAADATIEEREEDGPTLTHGEMAYGAAVLAAKTHGAAELVDPRPVAVGSIAETFEAYPHVGALLPAMGYGRTQVEELRETIARSDADLVLVGTP